MAYHLAGLTKQGVVGSTERETKTETEGDRGGLVQVRLLAHESCPFRILGQKRGRFFVLFFLKRYFPMADGVLKRDSPWQCGGQVN